ncbi:response regulator transcription factor [candidate division KSB1 bacterium]|nr:response regulator transcription factor [candidate division KSB1 bacterium]
MSKILIIEDSQPLISLLTKKLILEGFDSEFVLQSGNLTREDIVEQILDKKPDLIILDLNMPGAGGIAVLEELRFKEKEQNLREFPIVILTALDADQSEIEYLKSNARIVDYVQKPIADLPAFVKSLKKLI